MPRLTTILNINPTAQLRIRQPKFNSCGSVLLKTPEGIWDCVDCKELIDERYTEDGWIDRYPTIYGSINDDEKKKIALENEDATRFTFKNRLRDPATRARISTNNSSYLQSANSLAFTFDHIKWDAKDGTLELLVSREMETDKTNIARTEYTSVLLFFELVVFEEDRAGLKRTKSGDV
jgi:hypothetical protein